MILATQILPEMKVVAKLHHHGIHLVEREVFGP